MVAVKFGVGIYRVSKRGLTPSLIIRNALK